MAAVGTTSFSDLGCRNQRSTQLLARWAGVDDEKKHLQGFRALSYCDATFEALYDWVPIDARIAAI